MLLLADSANLLPARLQMAFTLGFHIIFACIGMGLPILIVVAEWLSLKKKDPVWRLIAQRWSKGFAVLFAVGAVSGTVLSFELGLLWPDFMGTFGPVVGLPFTLEGFAFFTEGIFVGIYLYGWNRLSAFHHWLCGIPIAIAGTASAWFVVTTNSFMNCPQGFELDADGKLLNVQPWTAMLNPATGAQTTHMIVAAYMVTGFLVAAFYAWEILRGRNTLYQRRALTLGVLMGGVFALVQGPVGHWAGHAVAVTQPIKLAAMEGQWESETYAPLRIGGIPDPETKTTPYSIEIPAMLSVLAYENPAAEVKGLNAFPEDEHPPVLIVHIAFQIMVGIGTLLIAIGLWSGYLLKWGTSDWSTRKLWLWTLFVSGPATVLAMEAGWTVTEVGRQPWIVHGYLRTADAVTKSPGVWTIFCVTMLIYLVLTTGCILVLRILAKRPMPELTDAA
ncbi:cytochrome ubiquinol oxidase subunit I [Blastopirellula retiformator]|uniref:Putative cytochrome bd menaquinol oxidase subunit I n=1 Tax=Blastopirellula retiformator TaxID=2527970 RepID=A0A5C5UXB9_9BACT|nr:cytochrome ubiquinol oxidase subunit I [Blastopirellula retiformator]TWT30092.1 putative cytochrome bd menaquinol oxidase subunit I [Blastopirellula retiformator]